MKENRAAMTAVKLRGLPLDVSFTPTLAEVQRKIGGVWPALDLIRARKQDRLSLNVTLPQASRRRRGGFTFSHAKCWKKRDCVMEATAYALPCSFGRLDRSRILARSDGTVDAHPTTELETWKLRKLAAAAELGHECVNVEALAAEVGLSKSEVLLWLEERKHDHLAFDDEIGIYMEDVTITEEVERPVQHVPAPAISERDMGMQAKVEDLMYALKDVLPGQLAKSFADEKKSKRLAEQLSENLEFQNPFVCLRGKNRFLKWMQSLAQAKVFLCLHDIYYENAFANKSKRWVTAVWTVYSTNAEFVNGLQEPSLSEIHESWKSSALEHAVDLFDSENSDIHILSGSAPGNDCNQEIVTMPTIKNIFEMSGETNFDMDEAGLVTHIYTRWYRTAKVSEDSFMKSRMWIAELLWATFSEPLP